MKWRIPAKTFLLGEYAAIAGEPAILLTTTPSFEMSVTEKEQENGVHKDSPAGQWWAHHRISNNHLHWVDPYHGKGGLGASSAQFLGAYLASCHLLQIRPGYSALLEAYYQCTWSGEGLRPSGYDILAQTQNRCVYVHRQQKKIQSFDWGFEDIGFILLHTGQKLATHCHLKNSALDYPLSPLVATVERAKQAFEQTNSEELIVSVNSYQQQLEHLGLVAAHSKEFVKAFKIQDEVLAAKGCGALGSDVILLIVPSECLQTKAFSLQQRGWTVLATNDNLYNGQPVIKNKLHKALEILP